MKGSLSVVNAVTARVADNRGVLPLHRACGEPDCPPSVGLNVLAAFEGAACEITRQGQTALHIACWNTACPAELLLAVLKAHPEAAKKRDATGHLPLQLALKNESCSPAVIRAVLAAHPAAAKEKDVDEPKEHGEVSQSELDRRARINMMAFTVVGRMEASGFDRLKRTGDLPLHHAIQSPSCAAEVVIEVLKVFPGAAREKDGQGRFPLHYAVQSPSCTAEVVIEVLKVFPGAAREKDGQGRFLLHHAIQSPSCTTEVVIEVLKVFPDAAREKDGQGRFLLHHAIQSPSCTAEVVIEVLKVFPDAAGAAHEGGSALHFILENPLQHGFVEVALAVLNACPEAARVEHSHGCTGRREDCIDFGRLLPFHGILQHPPQHGFVEVALAVLNAYPEAARVEHSHTGRRKDCIDFGGLLPFHGILQHPPQHGFVEVALAVLNAYPEAARIEYIERCVGRHALDDAFFGHKNEQEVVLAAQDGSSKHLESLTLKASLSFQRLCQAAPLDILDIGGNSYPLAAPGWWSAPGGDLVAMALAQHSALAEANQRFKLVTSDGAVAPATVPLLLSGPMPPKAVLVWLADEAAEASVAKHPRVD